nr:MAG TPA: hypothetical protein [Caudoviricetes sp.]
MNGDSRRCRIPYSPPHDLSKSLNCFLHRFRGR